MSSESDAFCRIAENLKRVNASSGWSNGLWRPTLRNETLASELLQSENYENNRGAAQSWSSAKWLISYGRARRSVSLPQHRSTAPSRPCLSRAVRIASASSRQCPASTSSFGRTRSRLPTASSNLPLLISHLGASAVECQWSLTGGAGSVDCLRMTKRPRNTTNGQQTWIDTGVIHLRDQSAFIEQLTADPPGSLRGL